MGLKKSKKNQGKYLKYLQEGRKERNKKRNMEKRERNLERNRKKKAMRRE